MQSLLGIVAFIIIAITIVIANDTAITIIIVIANEVKQSYPLSERKISSVATLLRNDGGGAL